MQKPGVVRKVTMKSQQGFTLLEVIIAISILAVGLLAVAAMQASALKATTGAYRTTESTKWAQDRLELLFSLPYGDPLLSAGSYSDQSPPPGYTITWNIADNSPVANTKRLTITVSWNERGMTRSTVLSCVKPRL
jgi:type IV pilus assembly protein PilV